VLDEKGCGLDVARYWTRLAFEGEPSVSVIVMSMRRRGGKGYMSGIEVVDEEEKYWNDAICVRLGG
jgi:hypothetical protein